MIANSHLLVTDEFGYLPMDEYGARLLFQVSAVGSERCSLVLTTNLEFKMGPGYSAMKIWPPR
ncbi:ATP-binding protein [Glutamicibacter uratoxydans]|uniref:ATP-binding protein n=1 Tax=Glutamicibacter uratoxydans TaxID=43667 RepID=UPI003CD062C3